MRSEGTEYRIRTEIRKESSGMSVIVGVAFQNPCDLKTNVCAALFINQCHHPQHNDISALLSLRGEP